MTCLTLEELEPRLVPGTLGLPDGDDRRLKADLRAAEVRARGPTPVAVVVQLFARPSAVTGVTGGMSSPRVEVPSPGRLPPVAPVTALESALMLFNVEPRLAVSLNTKVEDQHPELEHLGARDPKTGRWVGFLVITKVDSVSVVTVASGEVVPLATPVAIITEGEEGA